MKKLLLLVFISILSLSFNSQAACKAEAQIVAKLGNIKKKGYFHCVAEVLSVSHYNMNMTCPLDIDDVFRAGIDVGIVNGHDCNYPANGVLSGIIYLAADGFISLER